ncbi:PepSY domain-containing protein [Methylophaga sp. OBS4]|uniref:PepSY domain-containing protein n=1 Tax=Methylophaga sp. OBS4 TaxID=2991935 RepID=UPI0022565CA2|nr:PepSY domain-containing protein [Methylophaga sp. OBS4]MCX4188108.1 PepSY domain-containing protein [Methylophaga sp. OBS4]
MKTITAFTLIGLMTMLLQTTPARADDDVREMKVLSEGLGLITLEQAQAIALEAKPGVIDDADLESRTFGKGWDYEFEIVDADGNEWEVYINAKTGEVRKIEKDWF